MKHIYCAESQERIPPEYFKKGKAIFSGGQPYLAGHAARLKLSVDPAPPEEYAWVMSDNPVPPPSKQNMPAMKPPPKPEQVARGEMATIVCVSNEIDPAASFKHKDTPGASSTVRGDTTPIKDPLVASTVRPGQTIPLTPIPANMKVSSSDPGLTPVKPIEVKGSDIKPAPFAAAERQAALNDSKPQSIEPAVVPPPSFHPPPQSGEAIKHAAELKEPTAQPEASAGVKPAGAEAKPPVLPEVDPFASSELKAIPKGTGSAITLIVPSSLAETAISPAVVPTVRGDTKSLKTLTTEEAKAGLAAAKAAETEMAAAAKPSEVKPVTAAKPAVESKKTEPAKPPEVKPVTAAKPAVESKKSEPAKPAAAVADLKPSPATVAKPAVTSGAKPGAAPAVSAKKEPARVLAEASLGYGEPIPVEDLMKLPIFEGIPVNQVERLPGAIVKRVFKPGDIVCREGDYGSTAFYIVSGTADVYINAPITHVKSDKKENARGFLGIVRKFTTRLAGKKEDPREGESRQPYIPNDGPMDLPMNNPVAEMKPGDLFGEMSCMSFYPRSATVRAKTECVMYEMLRNMLTVLQKNKKFKEQVDKNYRERALGQHLRSVPILKDYVDDKVIEQLRNRVDLVEYDPGQVIIKQGDPSDAFYLVRVGCIKVSQTHPGGEIVLTYLGRGEYFGEIGLLKNIPRTATCTALDHVEVVKIDKPDFDFILSVYDELNSKLITAADQRTKATQHMSQHAPSMPLDDFISQGLMGAQNLLLLDLEKCTRCDECVRACADSHQGVTRLVREGLRFDRFLVPTSCRSCMDPVCMIGCPVGSIRRKDSMEIIIEDWCIGCEVCAKQCPYGNISMHPFAVNTPDPTNPGAKKAENKDKAVTCDLCTELKEPSCVYACPHDAAHRVNAREYFMLGGEIKDVKR